jgi:hypothetical protein
MSKRWTTTAAVRMATTISLFFLCMSPWLSETSAKEAVPAKASTYIASYESIPSNQLDFDGKGTLDAINPLRDANTTEKQVSLASAMVIISGQQLQFASDVQLFDERSQPLPADLLFTGDYVGFQKDPSDKIIKLWKVAPQVATATAQPGQISDEKSTAPRNDSPMRFVDGVWKN